MKIILINPPHITGERWVREGRCQQVDYWGVVFPPISLAYMKTQIKSPHSVRIIDCASTPAKSLRELFKEIRTFAPDLLILSTITPTFESDCNWFAKIIKEQFSPILIGAIGTHVSALPKESLKKSINIDFVIKGEPELTFKELVTALSLGKTLKNIKGICFRDGDKIINNPPRPLIENIDTLRFPDWGDSNLKSYKLPIRGTSFAMISYSRGCSFNCNFCIAHLYYGKKVRLRSIKSLLQEIDMYLAKGIHDFFLWAEMINAKNQHLHNFLDTLIRKGYNKKIQWVCSARVDNINQPLLKKMKAAGCWQIAFGLESGNNKILQLMKKGGSQTIDTARNTVYAAQKTGLIIDGHFILGYPGETAAAIQNTIKFACTLPLTFAHFYTPTPFPGTILFNKDKHYNWNTIRQDITPSIDLQKYISKAYWKFYFSFKRLFLILKVVRNFKELYYLLLAIIIFLNKSFYKKFIRTFSKKNE